MTSIAPSPTTCRLVLDTAPPYGVSISETIWNVQVLIYGGDSQYYTHLSVGAGYGPSLARQCTQRRLPGFRREEPDGMAGRDPQGGGVRHGAMASGSENDLIM